MAETPPSHGTVSVVIPVLNAETYLRRLLDAIFAQEPTAPKEVVLIDSMSTDRTCQIARSYERVRILEIADFSHGRARNLGARAAHSEFVVLMSQDALPADSSWLAHLLEPFGDETVAATFSRQVPCQDAPPMERFFLHTHFPPGSPVRRQRGSEPLTLERVFFSNVSSAIRRELLLEYPFDEELIMSEDQQWARDVIDAGFATVYQPSSVVVHSHNYTLRSLFRRYFDSAYSLTKIFPAHGIGKSASTGTRYLRREIRFMLEHHPIRVPYYALYSFARSMGTFCGHFAEEIPPALARRLSFHPYHWTRAPSAATSTITTCRNAELRAGARQPPGSALAP